MMRYLHVLIYILLSATAVAQPIPGDTLQPFDVRPFIGEAGSVERYYGEDYTLLFFWTGTDTTNAAAYFQLAAYADSAMQAHDDFKVVTISMDRDAMSFLAWRQIMQSALNDLPNCRFDYSDYDENAEAFLGIERLPYYLLIDQNGVVVAYEAALQPLTIRIDQLLKE